MISKRCLHCHAESSLALAEKELARCIVDRGKNYPGAMGALQAGMFHMLNPQVSWVLCSKHRRIQRAARAELDRETRVRMEADQRTWREREAARVISVAEAAESRVDGHAEGCCCADCAALQLDALCDGHAPHLTAR